MRRRILSGLLTTFILVAPTWLRAEFCVPQSEGDAYQIYYHNSGACPTCVQDWDMDFPEYCAFLGNPVFAPHLGSGFAIPVISDTFTGCSLETPHGVRVREYFQFSCNAEVDPANLLESMANWADTVTDLATTYGAGTVVNLSNGPLGSQFTAADAQAIELAYANDVLLVLAAGVSMGIPRYERQLGQKKLNCAIMNQSGGFVFGFNPTTIETNFAIVCIPTEYAIGLSKLITRASSVYAGLAPATSESGSFSTPLLSGSLVHVVEAAGSHLPEEPYSIDRVLDYVISSCDRPDNPADPNDDFSIRSGILPSLGPWSDVYAYGIYSPWKALIYAYGFGTLEALDQTLDANPNPAVVFSDHFELRGDLLVPAQQEFVVGPLASVNIVTATQTGPNLGLDADRQEIRVAGTMRVQSSLQDGANASVVVDTGGNCIIEDGGTLTIGPGMSLDVATGGSVTVESGGSVLVEGQFNLAGSFSVLPGASVVIASGAAVALQADLVVPAGASLSIEDDVTIEVASADAAAGGTDPGRVEITCHGEMDIVGSASAPVVIDAATPGSSQWVGIVYGAAGAGSNILDHVQISDAVIGVSVGGTTPIETDYLTIEDCGVGLKLDNRGDVTVDGGEILNCTTGIELVSSPAAITGVTIRGTQVGIKCSASSPTVRNCDIYNNTNGVLTLDSASVPDLGTVASHGNNDFAGPQKQYNTLHVTAFDPASDVAAQYNWWGTTKLSSIMARIVIIDDDPPGAGSVIVQPFLNENPSPVSGRDSGGPAAARTVGFNLAQNAPNPFNPTTRIAFTIESDEHVTLTIHDVRGRAVATLVDQRLPSGEHSREWDGRSANGRALASGVYFYRLKTSQGTLTRKALLLN